MASKLLTKPGQYGTLYRFAVTYQDDGGDPGSRNIWSCWAYSGEHAEEKFLDSPDAEGWEVLSVKRVRAAS